VTAAHDLRGNKVTVVAEDDPELETVRRTVTADTTKSIKRTLLTCLLIRAVRRSDTPPHDGASSARRRKATVISIVVLALGVLRWWHVIVSALRHLGH
jgi:hypothetical protein